MNTDDRERLLARFWAKVNKNGPMHYGLGTQCFYWTGGLATRIGEAGYGRISINGRSVVATHVAWFLEHGEFPEKGKVCCHKCDRPNCVNVDHLFVGTQSDNALDAVRKGRMVYVPHKPTPPPTHCRRGHPTSSENAYIQPRNGRRECLPCRKLREKARCARERIGATQEGGVT